MRESYTGPGQGETIKRIALHQDQQDQIETAQIEYGTWIPGISINDEKLFSPRLMPSLLHHDNGIPLLPEESLDDSPKQSVETDRPQEALEESVDDLWMRAFDPNSVPTRAKSMRSARYIASETWELYKKEVYTRYIDQNQSLHNIMDYFRLQYGFTATCVVTLSVLFKTR